MFSTSTQLKHWLFSGNTELQHVRTELNKKFRESQKTQRESFLTSEEEHAVVRHYEYVIKEFCGAFKPPMPHYVVGTSLVYFKRFYIVNSVMDYHPKDIFKTVIYLACKVEEFNVSIMEFVNNLPGNRAEKEFQKDIILSQELFLMQQLRYHLVIHNPYRPLEGLLLDIKTRYKDVDSEGLRKGASDFIDRSLNTDCSLVFAPSQIALAAVLSSASKQGTNIDQYVTDVLLCGAQEQELIQTVGSVKRIRYMVRNMVPLSFEKVKGIEERLELCRNQENNPEGSFYQEKMRDIWDDEFDVRRESKRQKVEQVSVDESDKALLGVL